MMVRVASMIILVGAITAAQDKPLPQTDRTLPVGQDASQSSLPSFDLPDFVITGRESIDIPISEKKDLGERSEGGNIERPSTSQIGRTEPGFVDGDILRAITRQPTTHVARAFFGIGSFSSFMAGAQASGTFEAFHLQGDAAYSSTSGFIPNTEATHVHLNAGVRTRTSLFSDIIQDEQSGLSFGFSRNDYLWYGSLVPSRDRTLSSGSGSVRMDGSFGDGSGALVSLRYGGGTVSDTSSRVSEGIFGIDGKIEGRVLGLPSDLTVLLSSGGKSGGSGGTYGGFIATFGSRWEPARGITTRFSIGVASISGETGQKRTVFLPGFSAGFEINPSHRFIGTYAPGVRIQGLLGLTEQIPFLDASQPIRHSFARNRGSISVESRWSTLLRSTITLESTTWGEYPIAADSGRSGVFRLFYGDVTETLIRASVVAKLPANHYFSAIAIVRSSKSSTSGSSVPYLPSSELRLSYRNVFTEQFEVEGSIQFVSAREIAATGPSSSVKGYIRADLQVTYLVSSALKVWAAGRNLLDATIEHWAGYVESPFALTIGMSYAL